MKKQKTKSMKTVITASVLALVLFSLAIVTVAGCLTNIRSVRATVEASSLQTAKTAALAVQNKLEGTLNILTEIGLDQELSAPEATGDDKQLLLTRKAEEYSLLGLNLADASGIALTGESVAQQAFFSAAMAGGTFVTSPVVTGDSAVLYMAAPVWEGGSSGTSVVGVVYATFDFTYLTDITNTITIGETGSSYIIDGNDVTIAHKSLESVLGMEKTVDDAQAEPSLQPLADLELRAISGETCFGEYTYGGTSKFAAMSPIAGTSSWALCVTMKQSEFMSEAYHSLLLCIGLSILALILAVFISSRLAHSVTAPVRELSAAAESMAQGDFGATIEYRSQNELGRLADSMREMMERTHFVVASTVEALEKMAAGNFAIDVAGKYSGLGLYEKIETALCAIEESLGQTLSTIKSSAGQVTNGAGQISNSAQSLAQGATEQAASIDELAGAIEQMRELIRTSARRAETASELSRRSESGIDESNQKMSEMTQAMDVISVKAGEIRQIISTIEDIAFQTNILALNAAVEAARASTAGKGFAVVADEVRNLAAKSSAAAQNTATLIEETVSAVNGGVRISEEVKTSLAGVTDVTRQSDDMMREIFSSAEQQTAAIEKISSGVLEISNVVQSNSATSEENAASSQELSAEASALMEQISRFTTK